MFLTAKTIKKKKKLYLPQTRTMYLSGMKYRTTVNTQRATMASQLRNGTVQLKVLNERLTLAIQHFLSGREEASKDI